MDLELVTQRIQSSFSLKRTLGYSFKVKNGTYLFPDVVDVEYESLENEEAYGISGISPINGDEQGTRADRVWVSSRTMRGTLETDEMKNVSEPIMAGNLSKLRPKRAIAWSADA